MYTLCVFHNFYGFQLVKSCTAYQSEAILGSWCLILAIPTENHVSNANSTAWHITCCIFLLILVHSISNYFARLINDFWNFSVSNITLHKKVENGGRRGHHTTSKKHSWPSISFKQWPGHQRPHATSFNKKTREKR